MKTWWNSCSRCSGSAKFEKSMFLLFQRFSSPKASTRDKKWSILGRVGLKNPFEKRFEISLVFSYDFQNSSANHWQLTLRSNNFSVYFSQLPTHFAQKKWRQDATTNTLAQTWLHKHVDYQVQTMYIQRERIWQWDNLDLSICPTRSLWTIAYFHFSDW